MDDANFRDMRSNKDIKILNQMLESNRFDDTIMKEVLSHYQDHPAFVPCKILKGAKIIRSSTNEKNGFHQNIARLSYPPVEYARTDRASLKGKPMFYASVFTSAVKNNAFPRIFSAMETTDILRDFQRVGRVFTTQSLWLSDRDLNLFAFPFSKKYTKPCDEIIMQRKTWDEELSKYWPEDYSCFAEYLGDLMAQECYSCLYEITANTIHYILYQSTAACDLDGVMYPSVWGAGQGMNICLKKEAVDECLHFQTASVQCIDKHVGESNIFGIAESYLLPNNGLEWIPTKLALALLDNAFGLDELIKNGDLYFGELPRN